MRPYSKEKEQALIVVAHINWPTVKRDCIMVKMLKQIQE